MIPRGDNVFEAGDTVFFITLKAGVDEIQKLSGKSNEPIKNIFLNIYMKRAPSDDLVLFLTETKETKHFC